MHEVFSGLVLHQLFFFLTTSGNVSPWWLRHLRSQTPLWVVPRWFRCPWFLLLWKKSFLHPFCPPPGHVDVPDDEVKDSVLQPAVVEQRATEKYPVESFVTHDISTTSNEAFTQDVQAQIQTVLHKWDPRILAELDQPFDKENLVKRFHAKASFRHVLWPLWRSGFPCNCHQDWSSLQTACYPARVLFELIDELQDVPIDGLRGFPGDWESETSVDEDRVKMALAALLHFNGSAADVVRWIGGPHVGAQRNHQQTFD